MSNLSRRVVPRTGYVEVTSPKDGVLEFLTFGILTIEPGTVHTARHPDHETALVLLSGHCDIQAGDLHAEDLYRENVFAGKATAVYVPPDLPYTIRARTETEIALCQSAATRPGQPALVTPDLVDVRHVGRENFVRHVHNIIDLRVNADKLVIGETYNLPGHWSSYPPHRHEENNPPEEVDMEELYYYRLNPSEGFGLQRIYTDDRRRDDAYVVEDGTVIMIPEGYHPVVAAGGYELYYLWVLAGSGREMAPRDDPQHAWVKDRQSPAAQNNM